MVRSHGRVGFSLIELLVVIAIVVVVIAILFPAVQMVREAASRIRCQNNLKQIGLGLQQYHEVFGSFPAAQLNDPKYAVGSNSASPPFPYLSWRGYVLPFVEQDTLWRETRAAFATAQLYWVAPPHVGFARRMQLFICPSDTRQEGVYRPPQPDLPPGNPNLVPLPPVALSGYFGVNGTDLLRKDGVIFYDQGIEIRQIKDGTSNTVMVGERPAVHPFVFGWWYAGPGQFEPEDPGPQGFSQRLNFQGTYTGSASQSLGAAELNRQSSGYSAYDNCPPGPYHFGPGDYRSPCDAFHFWSFHPGGANFLFADGSTRFLSYGIGAELVKLATRSGGEVTDD